MILLTCQLLFEGSTGHRILTSIIFDDKESRFVRVSQKISPELTQDLSSSNPMVDIMDVISLDYVDYTFEEEELEDIFEMVEEGPDNHLTKRALEFIKSYKREKKIEKIINNEIQKDN